MDGIEILQGKEKSNDALHTVFSQFKLPSLNSNINDSSSIASAARIHF